MHRFALAVLLVLTLAGSSYALTIEEIQDAIDAAGAQWTAGENEAWDMHQDYGWYTPTWDTPVLTGHEAMFQPMGLAELPRHLDWRDYNGENYVTRVKNQLSCGSCWAFATIGPIEAHVAIAEGWTDPDFNLSEQQLVSCCNLPGCNGCNGGFTTSSYDFAETYGLFDEECFPYTQSDSTPCDDKCADWESRVYKIDGWEMVGEGLQGVFPPPEDIMAALQYGPVGTSLTIYEDFYSYTEGIYTTVIGIPQGFHAVTIVGYDADQEIWICKNSWGKSWGEDGYFNIRWRAAQIGMFTILPHYTAAGDDDDDSADDDSVGDDDDDDDDDNDSAPADQGDDDDDDDDSFIGGCG